MVHIVHVVGTLHVATFRDGPTLCQYVQVCKYIICIINLIIHRFVTKIGPGPGLENTLYHAMSHNSSIISSHRQNIQLTAKYQVERTMTVIQKFLNRDQNSTLRSYMYNTRST